MTVFVPLLISQIMVKVFLNEVLKTPKMIYFMAFFFELYPAGWHYSFLFTFFFFIFFCSLLFAPSSFPTVTSSFLSSSLFSQLKLFCQNFSYYIKQSWYYLICYTATVQQFFILSRLLSNMGQK